MKVTIWCLIWIKKGKKRNDKLIDKNSFIKHFHCKLFSIILNVFFPFYI